MKQEVKDFLIERFIKLKGWDKFEGDIMAYGCIVTDKDGNRVDPEKLDDPITN